MPVQLLIRHLAIYLLFLTLAWVPRQAMASDAQILNIPTRAFANAYFVPDAKLAGLRAYLIFNQGEMHHKGTEGLAHYVEHLAWQNYSTKPGASRHSNAMTNLFSTSYWVEFDKTNANSRFKDLLSVTAPWTLDERFMLEERGVIEQEYNTTVLENPYLDIHLEKSHALFGDSGFTRSVIGTPEDIRGFDLDEARQLHRQSHQLKNATLLITGDSSLKQISRWLKKLKLPAIEQAPMGSSVAEIDLSAPVDEKEIASRTVPESTFYYDKLVAFDDCDSFAQCEALLYIVRALIDSSLPGGIANELRFDNFIARHFEFQLHAQTESLVRVGFSAQPDVGVTLDTLQQAFLDAWSVSASDGLPAESIEKVRQRIIDAIKSVDDKPAYAFRMLLNQLMLGREIYTPEQELAAVLSVKQEHVSRLLKSLHGQGRVVLRRIPKLDE